MKFKIGDIVIYESRNPGKAKAIFKIKGFFKGFSRTEQECFAEYQYYYYSGQNPDKPHLYDTRVDYNLNGQLRKATKKEKEFWNKKIMPRILLRKL